MELWTDMKQWINVSGIFWKTTEYFDDLRTYQAIITFKAMNHYFIFASDHVTKTHLFKIFPKEQTAR